MDRRQTIWSAGQGHRRRRRRGFTLVELLVVIGIIAVLLSILLPALSRAKRQQQRVACLSNLRQLGLAMQMYHQENGGILPGPGIGFAFTLPSDWVIWSPGFDLNTSVILPYLTSDRKFNPRFFMCPADPGGHPTGNPVYVYSYSVNCNICIYYGASIGLQAAAVPSRIVKYASILNPAEKILIICESSETADDGCWFPQNGNVMSTRHDRTDENAGGTGNAAFVDGHAAAIPRADAQQPHSYDPQIR